MSKLSIRIRELREEHKLSKIELAQIIGVSDVMIGFWERERSEPTARYIIALCDYFEVTADYLLGRSDF